MDLNIDMSSLEEEQESMQQDSLKLELHSVPLNLNWDEDDEEFEIDEDLEEEFDLMAMLDDPDQPSTSGIYDGTSTSLTVLNDISVDDDPSHEDSEEEPQEELIDLSSDLEANPENLLKLNIAYQEVLQQQIHTIDELLQQNQTKQDELKAEHEEAETTQSKAKAHLGLCLAPFFRANLSVPQVRITHPDVIRRNQEVGELYVENPMPPSKWTKTDEKRLRTGVERLKLKSLTEPILSNIEYLEEKYARSEDPVIQKKIKHAKQQLADTKETKLSALHGNRLDKQDWVSIANIDLAGTRTAAECSIYWKNAVHPSINKSSWSNSETEKLKKLGKKYKRRSWPTIAKELGTGRTPLQCCQRFQATDSDHKYTPWTPEEDRKLMKLVQQYGVGNAIPFTLVAIRMGNRVTSQTQVRWSKTLDPKIKRSKWTPDEDVKLLQSIAKFGLRWALIRDSGDVPGRNDQQCRERYDNVLRNINRGPWTKEEDAVIHELVKEHGEGHWSLISNQLKRRTDNQVLHRWKRLQTLKKEGKPVTYRKAKETNTSNAENLSNLRQRLIIHIEQELQRKKDQENAPELATVNNDEQMNDANTVSEEQPLPTAEETLPNSETEPDQIALQLQYKKNSRWRYNLKMEEKLKGDLRPDEMMELYRYLSAKHGKRIHDKPSWVRTDRIINEQVREGLSRYFFPFKCRAAEPKSNIHAIQQKVQQTAEKITPKLIFIHYVKGMNINAEKTLQAIKERPPPPPQPSPKTSRRGKRKSTSKTISPKSTTPTTSAIQPPEAAANCFPPFKRNHFLPLCAPNRATINAYRNLVKDRDRRVRTAKLMLIDKNKGKQNGESESSADETAIGQDVVYDGKKYKPEDLMKNIALTHEHRILRSRFVSLFAWPTILSTLVPYYRCGGNYRFLKPAVRVSNPGVLKFASSETSLAEDSVPSKPKRRKRNKPNNGMAA